MAKIITDKKLIDKFLTRGVEAIYPSEGELRKKLMSGDKLRIYQGFDPTGPYLHVGHAIGIRGLRILQQLGHEIIFLVGDFTAKVGDPDKDSTRKLLTDNEIEKNMAGWKNQASQLIDFSGENAVKFKRNHEWLSKLKLSDLVKLMSQVTVQKMLTRDLFDRRIKEENPIRLHEFIYPLMQGYDGVAMEVDMEIAGADQTFNTLVGRDLSMSYLKKSRYVRINKMMDAPDGRTMSKTKGNGINLGDTAENMFGKAMSYPDSAISSGLELLTDIPLEEINEIANKIKAGDNPMTYKKLMAFEIVKTIKGEKGAIQGRRYFETSVQKKETPAEVKSVKIKDKSLNIVDLLVATALASSKSEARRLVEQGGVRINSEVVKDIKKNVVIAKAGVLIQKGKLNFIRAIN